MPKIWANNSPTIRISRTRFAQNKAKLFFTSKFCQYERPFPSSHKCKTRELVKLLITSIHFLEIKSIRHDSQDDDDDDDGEKTILMLILKSLLLAACGLLARACDQIGRNFAILAQISKSLWQFFKSFIRIWQYFEPILTKKCYWAKFNCCK